MILPTNGRIVIVDNDMDDVEGLMEVFSKRGISFTYFNGSLETLPDEPLPDTFLVFLDLELDGSSKGDDKTQASQVLNVLKHILGPSLSDYSVIIVVWSNAIGILKELEPRMDKAKMNPIAFFEIEKASCKTNGHFEIDLINKTIEKKLAEVPALSLLYFWDNHASQAAIDVYKKILSKNSMPHAGLNNRLNTYYEELAKAYVGNSVNSQHVYATINMLNVLLSNEIGKYDCSMLKLETSEKNKTTLNLQDFAAINASINITSKPQPMSCGSVHINPFKDKNKQVTGFDIFENKQKPKKNLSYYYDNMKKIICEVSTLCDHAQGRKHFMRFCPGLLVHCVLEKYIKQHADYLYKSCLLCNEKVFDGEPFHIVLDFRRFFTINKNKNIPELLFQLNENLLMHTQNRLGRQISNPGMVFANHL